MHMSRSVRCGILTAVVALAVGGVFAYEAFAATQFLYLSKWVGGGGSYQCKGGGDSDQTGAAYRNFNDVWGQVGWARGAYYVSSIACDYVPPGSPGLTSTTDQPVHIGPYNAVVAAVQNRSGVTLYMGAYTTRP